MAHDPPAPIDNRSLLPPKAIPAPTGRPAWFLWKTWITEGEILPGRVAR